SQCMGIAVTNLWPTVHLTVHSHRNAIAIDTTKTRIPGLYSIKPGIAGSTDMIEHITLATMAEETIERMSYNCKPILLVDEINATLHAQAGWDRLLDEERQQMTFTCGNLFSNDEVEAICAL